MWRAFTLLGARPTAGYMAYYERAYYARAPVEALPKLAKHICAYNCGELTKVDVQPVEGQVQPATGQG